MPTPTPRLVLASGSTYRRALLERLGLPFAVDSPSVDESAYPDEAAPATAQRLAHAKAVAVLQRHPDALVIGSDQVATCNGLHIGKPLTHENALAQLRMMRGQRVLFHTALCLADGRRPDHPTLAFQHACVTTEVVFRDLPEHELDAYLRIEQPYDCAGSAKNEGLGIALLESIQSTDPTALTGLPLIALTTMLRQADVAFFQ